MDLETFNDAKNMQEDIKSLDLLIATEGTITISRDGVNSEMKLTRMDEAYHKIMQEIKNERYRIQIAFEAL